MYKMLLLLPAIILAGCMSGAQKVSVEVEQERTEQNMANYMVDNIGNTVPVTLRFFEE